MDIPWTPAPPAQKPLLIGDVWQPLTAKDVMQFDLWQSQSDEAKTRNRVEVLRFKDLQEKLEAEGIARGISPQINQLSQGQSQGSVPQNAFTTPQGPPTGGVQPQASIDLSRPAIQGPGDSFSTENTITIESDGKYYLIPTIVNGKQVSRQEAINNWKQTGQNVGVYNSQDEADQAAQQRSQRIGQLRSPQGLPAQGQNAADQKIKNALGPMLNTPTGKRAYQILTEEYRGITAAQEKQRDDKVKSMDLAIKALGIKNFKKIAPIVYPDIPKVLINSLEETGPSAYVAELPNKDGSPSGIKATISIAPDGKMTVKPISPTQGLPEVSKEAQRMEELEKQGKTDSTEYKALKAKIEATKPETDRTLIIKDLERKLGRKATEGEILDEEDRRKLSLKEKELTIGAPPPMPMGTQTGEAKNESALQGLTAEQKNVVKQLVDYKYPFPGSFALRTPYWQNILGRAAAYDPSFDATQYQVRLGVKKSFTSGKDKDNILALNTATGHIDSLVKAKDELANSNWVTGNTAINLLAKYFPVTPGLVERQGIVTAVKTKFNAVKGEMANIFKRSGATDQEIKSWNDTISDPSTATPSSWKAFINSSLELMGSRIESLKDRYEIGIGKPKDFKILSDKSRSILKGLGVDVDKLDPVGTTVLGEAPSSKEIEEANSLLLTKEEEKYARDQFKKRGNNEAVRIEVNVEINKMREDVRKK